MKFGEFFNKVLTLNSKFKFLMVKYTNFFYFSAICRVQVMDACLRCQSESSKKDVSNKDGSACVVGE